MSIFGTAAAQGITGRGSTDPAVARKAEKRKVGAPGQAGGGGREADGVDLSVENAGSDDAVRTLKDNSDQETREDRQRHNGYSTKPGVAKKLGDLPALDVEG